jgi:hypothetical protein
MVRKQLYLRKDQDRRLKRVAERMGLAEAEYVRIALDRALSEQAEPSRATRDPSAWDEIMTFLRARHAQGPLPGTRDWKREDIYDRPYPGRFAR